MKITRRQYIITFSILFLSSVPMGLTIYTCGSDSIPAVTATASFSIMLVLLLRQLRHIDKSCEEISLFLERAASGHLDERASVESDNIFSGIADNLNLVMDNLENMSSAKGQFVSHMSHEIRTPINAIVGMTQIAKNSSDMAKIKDCLEKIEDSSTHMIGIINEILDFSKIESGKLVLDEQLFSLKNNMDFVMSMFRTRAEEKELKLRMNLNNITHDGILGDSLRLNQVLINLISNAIKFTDAGGSVEVSVEEMLYVNGEGVYKFTVIDNGIGIDPQQARKLFTPFTQANAGITAHYGGSGLGLTISKSIIEKMGGDIELETAPGKGSEFSFAIRVKAQESADATSERNDPGDTQHPDFSDMRMMVVDDIEINRIIMIELLLETGIAVDTAEDGKDALDKFLASPAGYYAMLLMDMKMPVMDGCTSAEMIRKSGRPDAKTVKIVAMTANVLREDVQKAYDSGMDGHIAKPVNIEEVYAAMNRLLKPAYENAD